MKEIVTIQIGGFSNYICSHFWNFQDELLGLATEPHGDPIYRNPSLDMDVLYRAGETPQGIRTYTPRLLSIDFQGSLGSLGSCGSIYNETPSYNPSHVGTWTGKVTRCVSEPHKKNLFLQSLDEEETDDPQSQVEDKDRVECLESGVQYWTDFSKVHYHPRSLYELNGSWTDVQEFDNYGIGRDVYAGSLQGEEMNERLRFFVEECDHIQGFQFIVDDSGGFSSVAVEFLENIADEYTNTPVLLYSARAPSTYMNTMSRKKSISRALHDAVSFSRLSSLCKLMVPIGLPSLSTSRTCTSLCIDDTKPFHCSAVYAAALHSITLPFRMELLGPTADSNYASGAADISGIIHMLADQARQNTVAILDIAMPVPPLTVGQRQGTIQGSLHPLTPDVAMDIEDFQAVESMIIHGALHPGGRRASISEVTDSVYGAYQTGVTKPWFSHLSTALCPLPIPLPFPSIFGNRVDQHGELLDIPIPGFQRRGSLGVSSIPMAARLRSSNAILPYIEKRLANLRRFGTDTGAPGAEVLRSWGFQRDDVQDMGEGLSKMVKALDPHSEVSSDSD
ncbi:plasma membrane, autoregulation-binding site, misato segment II, myosin-like, tubulin/FtsZ protein [Tasmannia lanceolata]|uniref:plasma membrane, autoregulation-binding site, misato segment II, myosin-like, tubulin/FtsZ protein n=1 Tax=Tasmannia lanceolata TaxID=3420 RepID=UPI00406348C4